ncbi:MAG: aminoacyl--tRNA ligase-related protein [Patescibacteria group bacterium]
MRQSQLFGHTIRKDPKDEVSANAKLLVRAGFIDKVGAGIYSYLPLGIRVVQKISDAVRRAMNALGGQEILMPALHPKEYWEATGRWDSFDVLYRLNAREDRQFALGPTHEEILTPLAAKFISSYKDVPLSLYQIQTKFRDEPRVKSGMLRGREFLMKDMYSFHASKDDLQAYYERVKEGYRKLFESFDLSVYCAEAAGGTFSKYSHEFQAPTPAGEDTIYYCTKCSYARNKDIIHELADLSCCPRCGHAFSQGLMSEVGNIFNLGTKFSEKCNLFYIDGSGEKHLILMGCYGIGISRLMGVLVEVFHDDDGILWPESVAPFAVHLLNLGGDAAVLKAGEDVYQLLCRAGVEVLYDERSVSSGEKLKDADLIGIPLRFIISEKTKGSIEVKYRNQKNVSLMSKKEALKIFIQ